MRRVRVQVRRFQPEERLGGSFLLPRPSPVFLDDHDRGEGRAAIDDDGPLIAIPKDLRKHSVEPCVCIISANPHPPSRGG